MSESQQARSEARANVLRVGRLTLDERRGLLLDAQEQALDLRPQAYRVLQLLAANAGRLVTKDEIWATVWPDVVVTDDALVQAISDIRRVLGDQGHRLIKTVPKRGYLLVTSTDDPVEQDAKVLTTLEKAGREAPRRGRAWVWASVGLPLLLLAVWGIGQGLRVAGTTDGIVSAVHSPMPDRPSIAVLAFRDPADSPDGKLLARGMAESLVAELARNVDLRVISVHSSFALAGDDLSATQIGARLGSRYLVDGTVQRAGDRLLVEVVMIDSHDGHVVWTSKRAVDSGDVLAHRDDLVWRIAGSLHSRMRQAEEGRVLARPPKSLDVYETTLRALAMKHRFHPEAIREARRLLEQVLASDPEYAPAWLYLAMVNAMDSLLRLTGDWHPERADEMIAQAQRAIALDPQLPAAYLALALAQAEGGQFDAALRSAQQCAALGPGDADCLQYIAVVEIRLGLGQPALRHIEQALDLSPIPPPWIQVSHAGALWLLGRNEEAVRAAEQCLQKAPGFLTCRRFLLVALVELGRLEDARRETARILAQYPAADLKWMQSHFTREAQDARRRVASAALAAGLPASASP